MLLNAVASQNEIQALIDALIPIRISVDERRGRTIVLGRAHVELVPGHGLRLRGDARIEWDVAGVSIPVTLDAWQLLLVPRVTTRDGARVLAFDPTLEALDLKHAPAFLNGKITAAIRDIMSANEGKLAWRFARSLSRQLALPNRLRAGLLSLAATDASVNVTSTSLTLSVTLETAIVAKAPPAPVSAPRVAA